MKRRLDTQSAKPSGLTSNTTLFKTPSPAQKACNSQPVTSQNKSKSSVPPKSDQSARNSLKDLTLEIVELPDDQSDEDSRMDHDSSGQNRGLPRVYDTNS